MVAAYSTRHAPAPGCASASVHGPRLLHDPLHVSASSTSAAAAARPAASAMARAMGFPDPLRALTRVALCVRSARAGAWGVGSGAGGAAGAGRGAPVALRIGKAAQEQVRRGAGRRPGHCDRKCGAAPCTGSSQHWHALQCSQRLDVTAAHAASAVGSVTRGCMPAETLRALGAVLAVPATRHAPRLPRRAPQHVRAARSSWSMRTTCRSAARARPWRSSRRRPRPSWAAWPSLTWSTRARRAPACAGLPAPRAPCIIGAHAFCAMPAEGSDRFGLALAVLCTWARRRVDRCGVHIQRKAHNPRAMQQYIHMAVICTRRGRHGSPGCGGRRRRRRRCARAAGVGTLTHAAPQVLAVLSAMHSHFEAAVAAGGGWAALALPSAEEVRRRTPP